MSIPAPQRQSSASARPRRAVGSDAVATVRKRVLRGGLVLVFVAALVDGVFGDHGLVGNLRLEKRNAALETSIAELRDGNDRLIGEIKRLREDPAAIEELARDELELIKDGELLIILRDAPGTTETNQMPTRTSATPR